MSSPTTNFSWIKPTVGGDVDIWGGPAGLNFNLDSQDTLIRALANTNIANTAPTIAQSGTMWINNTTNPWIWSVYNLPTTTWIEIGEIDIVANTFTPINNTSGNEIGDYKFSSIASNHGAWLICDGSAISRASYSALFTLFNSLTPQLPFGNGDGSTTFNLPDMRGRVPGAIGAGSGLTVRSPGDTVGAETHTLTSAQLPNPITSAAGTFTVQAALSGTCIQSNGTGAAGVIANTGGGQSHNNMQPTLFVGNYFIYTGV
jgi:microcystin-dependent protein